VKFAQPRVAETRQKGVAPAATSYAYSPATTAFLAMGWLTLFRPNRPGEHMRADAKTPTC